MTGEQFKMAMTILLWDDWTIAEAADFIGCGDRTVRRLLAGDIGQPMQAKIQRLLQLHRAKLDHIITRISN